ncbi:MAG: sodium:proton exchanger [Candidatus Accumulibacter phosphatis]|uniref:Sodium:proton exchanger n=1 Tax=Candidatus Accumulibacter phosphatis TaxID=327160 RepID=A0A6A7RSP9_9PROT|nr:sodium:proton exchanger [Candidatus Accumulibacter phosphatis]
MLATHSILVVLGLAVLAPLLAELPIGVRVPVVVLEVVLGILIGPHVLGLIRLDGSLLADFLSVMFLIGMAGTLFMAGMEIDFAQVRGRPSSLALRGWLASIGLALAVVALLHFIPHVKAPGMVAIALTTTGLGALLPILRDGEQLETPFGRHVLAAGTIGEVGPIVAVSLLLSSRYSTVQEFGFLLALLLLVALAVAIGLGARPPRLIALLGRTLQSSTQLPVRLALFVFALFVSVSIEFGFEGILGAFAAGMIIGLATRGEAGKPFRVKMDAIVFGWFTPFFFIGTGMQFNLGALAHDATTMLLVPAFLVILLLVRGLPVLLYRNDVAKPQWLPFALSISTPSLGLIVVITQIGSRAKDMNPDVAVALVGAALLSLLVYPMVAGVLMARTASTARGPDLA